MRSDISDELVHWMQGQAYEDAAATLWKIISERRLLGSGAFIKENQVCVCFTEAPKFAFHKKKSKYRPFGVKLTKKYVFGLGGRPVIYQPDDEFRLLHDDQKWRHVRYNPNSVSLDDFTWEREWRLRKSHLDLEMGQVEILVPDQIWMDWLIAQWESEEESRCSYVEAMLGFPYDSPDGFPFPIQVLPQT